jgi:phosphatidylserine/phosphatidylglycerophosphate/cardiolipin synthase-like enzyme
MTRCASIAGRIHGRIFNLALPGQPHRVCVVQRHPSYRLGQAITAKVASHQGIAGIYPLINARDAIAARAQLATADERSLDVQYYIWRNDMTGTLL